MTAPDPTPKTKRPPRPLPPGAEGVKRRIEEILRVDHAGEYGAVHIYRGQKAVFAKTAHKREIAEQLDEMKGHEEEHLAHFDALLKARGARPTALAPFWRLGGFMMGATTALMGEKAAHACTAAVETVIEGHYADQIAEIEDTDPELAKTLAQFREDELHHRDIALEGGAEDTPGYKLISGVIGGICKLAIKTSEKI